MNCCSIYKTNNIKDIYKLDELLGEGSYSTVRRVIKKSTNEEFALKIIDKRNLGSYERMSLHLEIDILSQIDHPNIVKLSEVYEDKNNFYMVMELMKGGELFDRIVAKDSYSEKEASDAIRPVVDAIRYCHSLGVVHRDLKPENLLYESTDPRAIIKIADFGLAKVINNELLSTACGTPGYIAPEILEGKEYDSAVDIWSLGVIIYIMLCGFPPFSEECNEKLFEVIKKAEYNFPSPHWDDISDLAKDLITKLLVVDPEKRLSAEEILEHPWIVGDVTSTKKFSSVVWESKEGYTRKSMRASLMSSTVSS